MSKFIRKVKKHDLELLAQVYASAFSNGTEGRMWNVTDAHRLLANVYRKQSDLFFACYEENVPLGGIFATIKPWWDGNHLVKPLIFVSPAYQSQGVGTSLVKALISEAKKRYSITKVVAPAPTDSRPSPAWFSKVSLQTSATEESASSEMLIYEGIE